MSETILELPRITSWRNTPLNAEVNLLLQLLQGRVALMVQEDSIDCFQSRSLPHKLLWHPAEIVRKIYDSECLKGFAKGDD